MRLKLITGRTLNQGRGMMTGKFGRYYRGNVAIIQLGSKDYHDLELEEDQTVKVSSQKGEVVVKAVKADEELPRGVAYMPFGPWANRLMGPGTAGTGMPRLKGIDIEVEKAKGPIPTATQLMESGD